MKKLNKTDTELKKRVAYIKKCVIRSQDPEDETPKSRTLKAGIHAIGTPKNRDPGCHYQKEMKEMDILYCCIEISLSDNTVTKTIYAKLEIANFE